MKAFLRKILNPEDWRLTSEFHVKKEAAKIMNVDLEPVDRKKVLLRLSMQSGDFETTVRVK
jgi:hypothetical protein